MPELLGQIFLNAAMENFVKVTTEHKDEFNEEKGKYVDLLRQRCEVFKKEADEMWFNVLSI